MTSHRLRGPAAEGHGPGQQVGAASGKQGAADRGRGEGEAREPSHTKSSIALPEKGEQEHRTSARRPDLRASPPAGGGSGEGDADPSLGRTSAAGHTARAASHTRTITAPPAGPIRRGGDGSGQEDVGSTHPGQEPPAAAAQCSPSTGASRSSHQEREGWGRRAEGLAADVLAFVRFAGV